MFYQIDPPASVPLSDLSITYQRQNNIINCMKYLHTAYDGIILGNIQTDNIDLPYIVVGSVCLFCETMFYTDTNIYLIDDSTDEGSRFISLTYNIENKVLEPKIESYRLGSFDANRGKNYFYNEDDGIIKMYLNFSMYHKDGEYYSKKYITQEQN